MFRCSVVLGAFVLGAFVLGAFLLGASLLLKARAGRSAHGAQ
jgi:hypothetical protein